MTRREALVLAGAGSLAGRALRGSDAQNHAFPLQETEGLITRPERFFVRDHYSEPDLSIETWQLRIEGLVRRPYTINFSDLLEQPTSKVEAVMECSGNASNGAAAGNAVWEGVPISFLLQSAGIDSRASAVLLEGWDSGNVSRETNGSYPYSQIVPIQKCLESTTLVAFKINDMLLPRRSGFPARTIVPGWYAMDSVKWLRRIVVLSETDRPSSFHQSGLVKLYNRVVQQPGREPVVARLSSLQVKSVIAWPQPATKLPEGKYQVWGFAWSGGNLISKLEVSVDRGQTWSTATVRPQASRFGWARWEYTWNAAAGEYILLARATDSAGNIQPLRRDAARRDGYELNWCEPVRCTVR